MHCSKQLTNYSTVTRSKQVGKPTYSFPVFDSVQSSKLLIDQSHDLAIVIAEERCVLNLKL